MLEIDLLGCLDAEDVAQFLVGVEPDKVVWVFEHAFLLADCAFDCLGVRHHVLRIRLGGVLLLLGRGYYYVAVFLFLLGLFHCSRAASYSFGDYFVGVA